MRRFEAAWQSGQSPAVDDFLPADEPMRQAALVELVHIDLERRLKRGEAARVENYLARYPAPATDATVVVELLAEEYFLRLRENSNLQPRELFERFPQYAEQLRKELLSNSEVGIRARTVGSRKPVLDHATSDTIAPGGIADSEMSLDTDVKLRGESKAASSGNPKNIAPPTAQPTSVEQLVGELVRSKQLTRYQQEQVAAGRARSLILGNYTLIDKIGAGGMGQVFKAEHRRMHRTVAIKVLPSGLTNDPAAAARFEQEVEAVAKLSHPNIVTAHDADEAGGVHFLVMEYVDGCDLAALVKENGPLPVAKAVNYIWQAARGLEYAHGKGIVHRDIKPANLLVDRNDTVKILDLGLARIERSEAADRSALTTTGEVMGTVDYMSPEQAKDSKFVDRRTDIYGLGCTLYYFISGHAAYGGRTVMARLLAHRDEPIPTLGSDVPPRLQAVFDKMVAKKAEDRYQTMREVLAELEACATELSARQNKRKTPASKLRYFGKFRRRRATVIAAGLIGVVVLTALVVKLHARDGMLTVEAQGHSPAIDSDDAAFQKWTNGVAALPAKGQIKAVERKLRDRNPMFRGSLDGFDSSDPEIDGDVVRGAGIESPMVSDISPLRALPALQKLNCGCGRGFGMLSDLSPLKGMALKELRIGHQPVADISPLAGMKLESFYCNHTKVADLSPLAGAPLKTVIFSDTAVTDLSPLAGMAQLQDLAFTPSHIVKGIDVVRRMPSIQRIGTDWPEESRMPAEEFWKRYDAGQFK